MKRYRDVGGDVLGAIWEKKPRPLGKGLRFMAWSSLGFGV